MFGSLENIFLIYSYIEFCIWLLGFQSPLMIMRYAYSIQNTKNCWYKKQVCSAVSDSLQPHEVLLDVHGIFLAKILEWVCHFLFQGIFLTQGSNLHLLCLLHCKQMFLPLSRQGRPSKRSQALKSPRIIQPYAVWINQSDGETPSLFLKENWVVNDAYLSRSPLFYFSVFRHFLFPTAARHD